jgi:predicted NBD/HSP70 family sugar kinase
MEVFVGIDIGGSHVCIGYLDSTGQLIGSSEVKIDSLTLAPVDLIVLVKNLIDTTKDKDWLICSIGVGCPGQSKNGVLVAASNLPLFRNFNITEELGKIFTSIPILLLNDADAAVSAEIWGKESRSRYKDFSNIAMLTLGTGIGCGLILNGQLHQGSNGLIEAGHMIVATEAGSRACPCGQTGCVEAYASACTTSRRLQELDEKMGTTTAATAGASSSASTGPSKHLDGGKDVLLRYNNGDPAAVQVLKEVSEIECLFFHISQRQCRLLFFFKFSQIFLLLLIILFPKTIQFIGGRMWMMMMMMQTAAHLAVLCVNLCRVVDPDVIVFTGGLAKAGDVLLQLVQKEIDARTWTILPTDVKLFTAQSLMYGGAVGAALAAKMLLAKQQARVQAAADAEVAAQKSAAGTFNVLLFNVIFCFNNLLTCCEAQIFVFSVSLFLFFF